MPAFVGRLFPGVRLYEAFAHVDEKLGALPGLDGLDVAVRWCDRIQPLLPREARYTPRPPDDERGRVTAIA